MSNRMSALPSKPDDTSPQRLDAGLLRAAAAGDERAFTELYLRHAAAVARVVHRLVGDRDLDDVVQETFLHAALRMKGVREPDRVRAWLIAIAVRRAHRLLRRQAWRRRTLRVWHWFAPDAGDQRLRGPVDDVRDALRAVAPADRIAWTLHLVEGASLPETAAACGVSLATVKRRIARAQARLLEELDDA
jgi:RNA polymerase sigma-70 factor (ECF subfamily)